jgi:hypothetical protein
LIIINVCALCRYVKDIIIAGHNSFRRTPNFRGHAKIHLECLFLLSFCHETFNFYERLVRLSFSS